MVRSTRSWSFRLKLRCWPELHPRNRLHEKVINVDASDIKLASMSRKLSKASNSARQCYFQHSRTCVLLRSTACRNDDLHPLASPRLQHLRITPTSRQQPFSTSRSWQASSAMKGSRPRDAQNRHNHPWLCKWEKKNRGCYARDRCRTIWVCCRTRS